MEHVRRQRRPSPRAGIAYQAELNAENVILASSRVRLMTRRVAKLFCEDIGDLARSAGAKGLVMDLDSVAATPRAAVHAMRHLREMPVSRVALVGGSRSTRRLASVVLTLGRYGDFRFFADCEAAISWAAREGEDSL